MWIFRLRGGEDVPQPAPAHNFLRSILLGHPRFLVLQCGRSRRQVAALLLLALVVCRRLDIRTPNRKTHSCPRNGNDYGKHYSKERDDEAERSKERACKRDCDWDSHRQTVRTRLISQLDLH